MKQEISQYLVIKQKLSNSKQKWLRIKQNHSEQNGTILGTFHHSEQNGVTLEQNGKTKCWNVKQSCWNTTFHCLTNSKIPLNFILVFLLF